MAGWDQYLHHMQNYYSVKKGEYLKQNVCESCAIIGLDGVTWAASPKWKPFSEYEHTVEGEDGEMVC